MKPTVHPQPFPARSRLAALALCPPARRILASLMIGFSLAAHAQTAATTVTLTSTGSAGSYTLLAAVSSRDTAAGAPTGSVSFIDSSNSNLSLGSAALGTATTTLSFAVAASAATPDLPSAVVIADFNGDGKPDLAVLNDGPVPCSQGSLSIYLGNGDGAFTSGGTVSLADCPSNLVAGDFNGDSKMDIAVGSGQNSTTVLYGDGSGGFTAQSVPLNNVSYSPVATGDFNGDGVSDLAFLDASNKLVVLLGQKDGTFTTVSGSPAAGSSPIELVSGDFNGDGKADLAVLNSQGVSTDTSVVTLLGNGDGTFQSGATTSLGTAFGLLDGDRMMAAGDIDGDGKADLAIVGSNVEGGLSVSESFVPLLSKGDGTFTIGTPTGIPAPSGGKPSPYSGSIGLADFNGDGKADVVVTTDSVVRLYLSKGDGTFTASAVLDPGASSDPDYLSLAVADLNGDGVPDVAEINSDEREVYVDLTQGKVTATASLANVSISGTGSHQITATYTGDSKFAASTSGALPLAATQISTSLGLTASPASISWGEQVALTASLAPYSKDSLTTDGETVTFSSAGSSIGTGTLSSGVATLNITSLPVGADSITASYPGDSNFAGSSSTAVAVTVAAAVPAASLAPSSLTFSQQATGSTSSAQTITLSNTGQAALTISSIAASGDFAETNTCGTGVAAGATCSISVTSTPTVAGTRTGTLTVTDNAPGSPQTVSLTGSGYTVGLTSSSTSLSVARGQSVTANLQISSAGLSGTVNLACSVAWQGSGTATVLPSCSLNPAQVQAPSGTSTLTVSTTGGGSARLGDNFQLFSDGSGTALACVLLFFAVPRRRIRGLLLLALVGMLSLGAVTGCGGGSSKGSSGTTAGSYSVTVTASDGSATNTLTIPLTVQ